MKVIHILKEFIVCISLYKFKLSDALQQTLGSDSYGNLDKDLEGITEALKRRKNEPPGSFVERTEDEFKKTFLQNHQYLKEKLEFVQAKEGETLVQEKKPKSAEKSTNMIVNKEESKSPSLNFIKDKKIGVSDTKNMGINVSINKDCIHNEVSLRDHFLTAAYKFMTAAHDSLQNRILVDYKELADFECFEMKDAECSKNVQKIVQRFQHLLSEDEKLNISVEAARLNYNWTTIRDISSQASANSTIKESSEASFLYKWENGATTYPSISKIARAVQVLPYSTVPIERKFSQITDIKTVRRNRLSTESLEGCLLFKQEYGDNDAIYTEELINAYKQLHMKPTATVSISSSEEEIPLLNNQKTELVAGSPKISFVKESKDLLTPEEYTVWYLKNKEVPVEETSEVSRISNPLKHQDRAELESHELKKFKNK